MGGRATDGRGRALLRLPCTEEVQHMDGFGRHAASCGRRGHSSRSDAAGRGPQLPTKPALRRLPVLHAQRGCPNVARQRSREIMRWSVGVAHLTRRRPTFDELSSINGLAAPEQGGFVKARALVCQILSRSISPHHSTLSHCPLSLSLSRFHKSPVNPLNSIIQISRHHTK
jgi:hypothetical protein